MKTPVRRGAAFDAIKPDPDKVGGVAATPFVRLPDPARVFAARAERLAALAPGNPLQAYMLFLVRIVNAQHRCLAAWSPNSRPLQPGRPPLSMDSLQGFGHALQWLLENIDIATAPAEAREARDRLAARPETERWALAGDVFQAAYPADCIGESIYVAAALQVCLGRQAALLDSTALQPVADGACPVCGQAPVASVVVGWTQASKARYLCCSMCCTLWNVVRIKCTSCGATQGVSYYTVGDTSENVAAEACSSCQTYLKHLHQHRDPLIDPFADDVASYGLDLMLRDDFRRSAVNPLFVIG